MTVELLEYFGNDLMIANAARVSYGKSKKEFDNKDAKLIKFLLDHGHTSPFRHPQLQFRIKCPIFVERQLFKHQVGLVASSISGRYVDFSDEYWLPTVLRKQAKSSKQGSDGEIDNPELLDRIAKLVEDAKNLYADLCDADVAKEMARVILPLCLQTQFIWTGSLAAFIHLWKLRLKSDAQKETRDVAMEMLRSVENIEGNPFKYTLEAVGINSSEKT
jgi:thymidylate synthase (FAD)